MSAAVSAGEPKTISWIFVGSITVALTAGRVW